MLFSSTWFEESFHTGLNGEKHIADVKTKHGVTVEFQHSFLPGTERLSREPFCPKLTWVVDANDARVIALNSALP
jgi:competence protein CoiA